MFHQMEVLILSEMQAQNVINVQMFDAISFLNKAMIEINMYVCVAVRRASGALAMKHTPSMSKTPFPPCVEKKPTNLINNDTITFYPPCISKIQACQLYKE